MNLPNTLTVFRLALTFVLAGVLVVDWPWAASTALAIFIVASLTDWLDGYLARSRNQITTFGKLLDPVADKVLVCATFICLIGFRDAPMMPAWMIVVIIARELLITCFRIIAADKGVVLPAERIGKYKTTAQMMAAIAALLFLTLGELGQGALAGWIGPALFPLYWLAVGLTAWSGINYLWINRALLSD